MYKRLIVLVLGVLSVFTLSAQEKAEDFQRRYDQLVARVGYSGLGVETLLNNWDAAYPEDIDMLVGKFMFYFSKSATTEVKKLPVDKYLGQAPTLSLKDSLGNPVNFFQVNKYDDELFGKAITSIDRAIQLKPNSLELRQAKITSYIAYEADSPDMAERDIFALIDYNFSQHPKWIYPGVKDVDAEFFDATIQEFCFSFFNIGGEKCFEAFKDISERMLKYAPKAYMFLDNVGSYYLVVKKDNKKALKYYKKVLKIKKDDLTAIKNCIILARNSKDKKLEKKYLEELIKYTEDETEKKASSARLNYLNK